MAESWSRYVRRVAGTLTQAEIAEQSGVAASNIGRWLRADPGLPRAESVIAFARAFGQSPLEAMIAAGYFTPAEAATKARTPLSEYGSAELIAELHRRNLEA